MTLKMDTNGIEPSYDIVYGPCLEKEATCNREPSIANPITLATSLFTQLSGVRIEEACNHATSKGNRPLAVLYVELRI
jgi:hypothetical protein